MKLNVRDMIVQKLNSSVEESLQMAERYYGVISAINNLGLTTREIQLISFTAVRGNMSYANIREDFCEMYNTSSPTINNIISKLKKKNILVKDKGKIKVHPAISLDFNKDVRIEILFRNGNNKKDSN